MGGQKCPRATFVEFILESGREMMPRMIPKIDGKDAEKLQSWFSQIDLYTYNGLSDRYHPLPKRPLWLFSSRPDVLDLPLRHVSRDESQ